MLKIKKRKTIREKNKQVGSKKQWPRKKQKNKNNWK